MSEQLHADQVARKEFSLSFRGFDQHEVRAFLAQVAGELGAWEERERSLRSRIAELEMPAPPAELDEAAIEAALGQTATRIIHAAREAASEVRARAEAESAQKLEEAEAILAKSADQAAATTAAIRAEAEESVAAMLEQSRAESAAMMVDAAAERDRTLRALGDRRVELLAELEELATARDRLRHAYESVQRALDAALHGVDAAGERAGELVDRVRDTERAAPKPSAAELPDVVEVVEAIEEQAPPVELEVAREAVGVDETASAVGAEPDTEPDTEPEPDGDPEERRSSALKLLRPTTDAGRTPSAPPSDDPYEGVRIIRTDAPVAAEDESSEEATAPVEEVEPEPQPEEAVVELVEVVEVLDVEVMALEPDDELAPEPEADEPVEDLFARLRADRAEKVAKAEAVLAATDASPSAPTETTTTDDADELAPDLAILAARDAAVADAERSVVRSLKRALADEQNEVLDALRRLRGAPTLAGLLPDSAVHDARYDAVLNGGASRAAAAGGELGGGSGGNASGVTAEIGRAVAADLRGRVERSIEDASGDVDTLAEGISATYREWKTARAETLAREVITAAYASGTYAAASGPLRWVVDPAEGGCPDCEDNVLAGATDKGTAFPTGQLHPPAHAGCRCAVVPAS